MIFMKIIGDKNKKGRFFGFYIKMCNNTIPPIENQKQNKSINTYSKNECNKDKVLPNKIDSQSNNIIQTHGIKFRGMLVMFGVNSFKNRYLMQIK